MTWFNILTAFVNNKKVLLLTGFILLGFYFLPYLLNGKNIYVSVYDNMDSSIVWFKVLAHSGMIFADSMAIIPNMMSGLPRISYGTEFNGILWLYYFFDDFTAYVINDIFIHTVAFMSMFVLLGRYFIDEETPNKNFIIFSASILFAMIPFWPAGGLSVAGQPLALWAFLNIRAHRSTKVEWVVLGLLPFYSSFVLSMIFFLFAAGVLFLYDVIVQKKVNIQFIMAIIFMTAIYFGIEYRLVANMLLGSEFVSHRVEFVKDYQSLDGVIDSMTTGFLFGFTNILTYHHIFVLPTIVIAIMFLFIKVSINDKKAVMLTILYILLSLTPFWWIILGHHYITFLFLLIVLYAKLYQRSNNMLLTLMLIQLIITYWMGFWFYEGWKPLGEHFKIIETFNFGRLVYLQPIIWYLMLGLALQVIAKYMRLSLLFLSVVLLLQSYFLFGNRLFTKMDDNQLSYNNYYAADIFKKINDAIDRPKDTYRVASIGLDPVIAVYNGFYTIDGYSANYPLTYKHQFQKIIENVNKVDDDEWDIYKDWGSKCYIFQNEFGYDEYIRGLVLTDFDANTSVMYELGVRYLFSAYKIENLTDKHLQLIGEFTHANAFWKIYLYKIDPI